MPQISLNRQVSIGRAKNMRRQRIIDAAEELIKQSGSTEFSMKQLAEKAGISTYTTYNLIGSKSTVLYTLLNRSVDRIGAKREQYQRGDDPVRYVFDAGRAVVDILHAEEAFYRPLMRHLLGVLDAIHRPAFMERSLEYWRTAFVPLQAVGALRDGATAVTLATQVRVYITGALDFWVHEELTGEELQRILDAGLIAFLAGCKLGRYEITLSEIVGIYKAPHT